MSFEYIDMNMVAYNEKGIDKVNHRCAADGKERLFSANREDRILEQSALVRRKQCCKRPA